MHRPTAGGVQAPGTRTADDRRRRFAFLVGVADHFAGVRNKGFLFVLGILGLAVVEAEAGVKAERAAPGAEGGADAAAFLARAGGVQHARMQGRAFGLGKAAFVRLERRAVVVEAFGAVFDVIVVLFADIAVDRVAAAVACVGGGAQFAVLAEAVGQVEGALHQAVAGGVRVGVHGAPIGLIQGVGQQAIPEQAAASAQQGGRPVGGALGAADFYQHVAEVAGRVVAPAVVVEPGAADEAVPAVLAMPAVAQVGTAPAFVGKREFEFAAGMGQPGLGGEGKCATQGVQAI